MAHKVVPCIDAFVLLQVALASSIYGIYAYDTSNTAIKPNPEVTIKTVDQIELNRLFYCPNKASFGCNINPFMPSI